MDLQTNVDNTGWVINGIKYAIYKRISPGLTHDLVGPLSVALIQAGIIKRKLKAQTYQAAELLENTVNLENYIKQTVLLIRAMKNWDTPNTPIFDSENVCRQCIKFFQTRLAMREIDLILIESSPKYAAISNFQAFLFSWLALLCYLEDTLQTAYEVHIQQIEVNAISIQLKQKDATEKQLTEKNISDDTKSTEKRVEELIGKHELFILSQHYATQFEFDGDSILFTW